VRPAGELPEKLTAPGCLLAADTRLENRSRRERSSTDANIPLSVGIPAISIGAGGRSGGAHTTEEWFEPTGRELGLQRRRADPACRRRLGAIVGLQNTPTFAVCRAFF